jgi:hypothetical protein
MDAAVSDTFTGEAEEIDRLMYGFSLLVCLPDGMSTPGSVGTGTVMRPDVLRGYAIAARLWRHTHSSDRRWILPFLRTHSLTPAWTGPG